MRRPIARRLGGLPIFWQTMFLLIAGLVVAQLVGILLLFVTPPPRPDFNRMSDIVAALGGPRDADEREDDRERERRLVIVRNAAAPAGRPRMVSDPAFVALLAQRLGTQPARVRLFFEPERGSSPMSRGREPVRVRHGEPLFFTPVVAAVEGPRGWRIAETPPAPLIAPWQRRMMLWFGLSALVMLPLAFLFARALTRPISRFADAADRLGADPQAPSVMEEGPAELRVTARALNRMQARMGEHVRERTAMIGAIAHDLRTPLARIAFRIEAAPEELRDRVFADIEQMRAMLAATIGFVRNTDGARERAPVALDALAAALAEREREMGHEVALGATEPLFVLGDALALERLLQNLVDNALAYGGAAAVSIERAGGEAHLLVADRGPGLSDEMLARAFEPFERGEPSRNRATGGIGLGLTIARTIAENHGGTIALANRPGGGLTATCRLPLLADAPNVA